MRHRWSSALTATFAAAALAAGCGEGRQPAGEQVGERTPSVQTDPIAERGFIRLTGCVKPDATPGQYVLASVATSGVLDGDGDRQQEDERSWTAEDKGDAGAQGAAIASSTYQLIPGEDDDLSQYENTRVTVRGRLAAERPAGTSGTDEPGGRELDRDAAGSKVVADAPPLRGFHVESVDPVADSCE